MNSAEELKILRQLSSLLTNEEMEVKRHALKRTWVYAVSWIALAAAFGLVMGEVLSIIAVAVAAFAGISASFAMYWGISAKQWVAVRSHINGDSVTARVKQLEK